jgi:hypothetical protein
MATEVICMPGKMVVPTGRPSGYHTCGQEGRRVERGRSALGARGVAPELEGSVEVRPKHVRLFLCTAGQLRAVPRPRRRDRWCLHCTRRASRAT